MIPLLPRFIGNRPGLGRAEEPQLAADRHCLIEDFLLLVRVLRQDEERLLVEGSKRPWVGAFGCSGDPAFVLAEEIPDGAQDWWGIHLKVEVHDDQRPARAVVIFERLLDDGTDALEEMSPQ